MSSPPPRLCGAGEETFRGGGHRLRRVEAELEHSNAQRLLALRELAAGKQRSQHLEREQTRLTSEAARWMALYQAAEDSADAAALVPVLTEEDRRWSVCGICMPCKASVSLQAPMPKTQMES